MRRQRGLDEVVLGAFARACAEARLDVAEHLLCALEAMDPARGVPGSCLAEAYRSIAARASLPYPGPQTRGPGR